ncbi:uncharacterized protein [Drosophila tropicalis]|uniref:uncharacterized protein n=1 Tax=Drosophila tropicalis TaxID=46794 RepID=UPI0035ABF6B2
MGPLQEPDRDFGLCPPKIFQDTARTAVPIFTSAKQKAMVTHSAVRDTWHYDHEAPQLPFLTSNNTRATTREQPHLSATPMAPWNFTNTQNRAASYYPENKVRMDVGLNTAMPSAAQLAARQAIPKELPTFDGNPQNWPLFYSSFQTSTEIAGYTNAENLMRLQASLKGKARYMHNPLLVQELLEKLPTQLKLQWAMFPKDTKIPSMESFSKWIYDIAEAASQVTSPLYHKKSGSLNHHTEAPEEQVKEITCVCQREKVCGIRGCRSKHHPLIHEMQPIPEAAKSSSPIRPAMVTNVHTPEGKHTQRSRESGSTYFRVIPIQIINKTKVTNTFAFLDEGSALTRIDNKDTTREENASERVTLTVANPHNGNQFYLEEVHSVDTLDLPVQSIDIRALAKEFPHLAGLPIASYINARPSILIGTNKWNLAVPLKIKEGAWHQPIASKTRLGWALQSSTRSRATRANKVRLVWDAAAQSGGKALNDYIWSGPDLLNSLFDLLLSFRVGRVAICGDIAEMFHQIRVKPADTHAQRFLWFDSKSERQEPNVMEALTFGINCAPCIAHFIRDKNADRFCQQYPQAAQAVKDYHYVDDFIYSGDDYVEVGNIATQVRDIHAAGGFHIRNWSSNSKEVLRILKSDSLLPEAVEITATEKVLGLYWVPNSDVFTFICKFARLKRNVLDSDKTPTKRELLQVLMSMYDPLGFISCFTIELKILLQEVWRSGIGWDTGLPDALLPKWIRWKRILTTIAGLTIPRCYFDSSDQVHDVQLHTFVDASELAYAAVCYLRIRQGKRTYLSFVASKAKVAPLSPLSIPRMELQAAVIGAKLNLATKTHNANKHETWLHGPDYLLQDQHECPKCDDLGQPNNAEVRHNILFIDNAPMELKLNAEYFSDWRRLYRALARFILYIEKLKAKQKKGIATYRGVYEMIQQARTLLLRHAQSPEFNPETRNLTRGRRSEKRWGVIFTCLTIRAMHIELACSLDTASCIMCIRNFINRRGTPREIYSDNGTNFKAAEKIICDKAQTINFNAVQPAFDDIKWKFNPPAAPHMGGSMGATCSFRQDCTLRNLPSEKIHQ